MVLFVYKDIIAKDIFPQLTQTQATLVIFSIIGLTFFIAIIGIYAWLATKKDIQFKYVIVFMLLILTILAFIAVAIYVVTLPPEVPPPPNSVTPPPIEVPLQSNSFYLNAINALSNGNKSIALDYVNRGLEKIPK